MSEANPIIATEELTKVYKGQVAVDHLTFKVEEGEIFGFLGPNGAGKTTTLLMLLGLTEPTSGRLRVMDLDPTREPIKVKSKVGYLQENMGFYPDLNARQMLRFVAELNGIPAREADPRIDAALEAVGWPMKSKKKSALFPVACASAWASPSCSSKTPGWPSWTSPPWGLTRTPLNASWL